MKKVVLFACLLGAVAFTSCSKSGKCVCNGSEGAVYDSGDPGYKAAKNSCKLSPACSWETE